MERVAFTMKLLPGAEAEYRRRHAAVWPEMLEALRAAGCRDYSIYQRDDDLFGVFEVDDFERIPLRHGRVAGQCQVAGRDGLAHRSLHRPGDGLPPAAGGGLPP